MKQARFYKMQDNAIVDTGLIMKAQERWRTSRLIEECINNNKDCDYIKVFENHEQVSDFILINSSLNTDLKANSKETLKMTETISIEEIEKKYSTKTEDPLITAMKAKSAKSWTKTEKKLANMVENFTQELNTIGIKENSKETLNMENTTNTNSTNSKAIESYNLTIAAMNSVIKTTNAIIDELGKGYTLKAAKSELGTFVADTENLPIGIKKDIKDADKAKTKALYIESLELVKGNMVKSIKVALDAIKDIEDGAKNDKPELDTKALETMSACIREAIAQSLKYHFEAGRILSEALEMFKAAGKPAKDWLEWANLACQVKKAQAYSLVKIYNDFGQVSEFKDCSMRVLNILVHCSKDIYSKIEEQAKALAKAGKLDTKAINKLIDAYKPVNANSTLPKSNPAKSDTSDKEVKDQTGDTIKASLESNDTGDNNGDNNGQDEVELRTSTDKADKASKVDDKDKLIAELREQNLQLLARIEELSKAVNSSKEDDSNSRTVTYLPQFEAKSPNLVLGIEADASKEEINKRYRTMAVIFNAKTCPKGAKALKAAREAMLKTAKN